MRVSARARVWSGAHGVHLGWLDINLVVAFGCSGSEKVDEVVGEVNVEAARSWACSFTSRHFGKVGDGVGYRRFWPWKSIALASLGVGEARKREERGQRCRR
jgi:hypothetical protein